MEVHCLNMTKIIKNKYLGREIWRVDYRKEGGTFVGVMVYPYKKNYKDVELFRSKNMTEGLSKAKKHLDKKFKQLKKENRL